MKCSGLMSGGAPLIKSYQIGAVNTTADIPLYAQATAGPGLIRIATAGTEVRSFVGVSLDAATYSTTQGTGANSAEAKTRVVINPDAMYRARYSGDTSEGTDLAVATVTTASAGGTAVTDANTDFNTVDMVDGIIWCISGSNVGQSRLITSTGTTAATVTVPFDNATVVGDTYGFVKYAPAGPILGTADMLFVAEDTEMVGQGTAPDTTAQAWVVVDVELNDVSDTYGTIVSRDSIFVNYA